MTDGYGWVSLTTDYGLSDGFVAACHGVIARYAPAARVIDVTHLVPPGEVATGAAVLAQTVPHLPISVHVAVVDPGVGTGRRAVVIEAARGVLIGPDNGLLLPAAQALGGVVRAFHLTNADWFADRISPTFHGRDVFSPSAARVAAGADLAQAGPSLNPADLVRLPEPVVRIGAGCLEAEVITVDRFGNVQLAAAGSALAELDTALIVGGVRAVRGRTFNDAFPGELVVYRDSSDHVAIAVNGGRAVVALSVSPGDLVRVSPAPKD